MQVRNAISALTLLACVVAPAFGQGLEIDWFSVDGGGITFASGAGLELGATIGQHDATTTLAGSGFELTGGFWAVGAAVPPSPCPGDLNGDGIISLNDLTTLLSNFGVQSGATFAQGDGDGDGDIDLSDLTALLSVFGSTCP